MYDIINDKYKKIEMYFSLGINTLNSYTINIFE